MKLKGDVVGLVFERVSLLKGKEENDRSSISFKFCPNEYCGGL